MRRLKRPFLTVLMAFVLTSCSMPLPILFASPETFDVEGTFVSMPSTTRRPNFGPHRTSVDMPPPSRAYSPFEETLNDVSSGLVLGIDYQPGQILVKMAAQRPSDEPVFGAASAPTFFDIGIETLEQMFPAAAGQMAAQSTDSGTTLGNMDRWYRATLKTGYSPMQVVDALTADPAVEVAEPDYIRRPMAVGLPTVATDPLLGDQWHIDAANIDSAWAYLADKGMNPGGSREVTVAIIDTGVDYTHPELAGNMWINTAEISGNGTDDDNNGYVDDIHGADFITRSGDPMDDHGHGTHVAGIVGAVAGNDEGGVGVAYNVKLMALKAGQSSGVFSASDIARAIYYAVDKGADVINMSFGGYGRSMLEEDALEVAFGQAVLVAAAGNADIHNEPGMLPPGGRPVYPAAHNWVLGVMAQDRMPSRLGDNLASFSNWDMVPKNSREYEIMAPGVGILSTLPNGQYASWSGTSMAAPVVAGVAALVRSNFPDKNVYSSRFIMGQIAATGTPMQGKTFDPLEDPLWYRSINATKALTETPEPSVTYLEHYIFDTKDVDADNNADGIVDAGETIDLAVVIRNHWGKADDVSVSIDALSPAGIPDPYVDFLIDTVHYGAIGNFGIDDNGLTYDDEGMVTGVRNPFKIGISQSTPNNHVIPISITISARNGFDPDDTWVYTSYASFWLTVRKGKVLPRVIDSDMVLTKDDYWIVPDATLIEAGATVKVEPGTQIQFWGSDPEDPYAEEQIAYLQVEGDFLVQGTAQEPVEMFSSFLLPGAEIKITGRGNSHILLAYACVANPVLSHSSGYPDPSRDRPPGLYIDHCVFTQDLHDFIYTRYRSNSQYYWTSSFPLIRACTIASSRLVKLGGNVPVDISAKSIQGCLFDSCCYDMNSVQDARDNVLLKNYKLDSSQWGDRYYLTSRVSNLGNSVNAQDVMLQISNPAKNNHNGSTYFVVQPNISLDGQLETEAVQEFAGSLGGHIAVIEDAEENEIVRSLLLGPCIIGLNDFDIPGQFCWANGEASTYRNWASGEPNAAGMGSGPRLVSISNVTGLWSVLSGDTEGGRQHVVEIPGPVMVAGVTVRPTLTLGLSDESVRLKANVQPSNANNKSVWWASSDPEILTVDQTGLVTPLQIGSATVTAATLDGGFTGTCFVTVSESVAVSGVQLEQDSLVLPTGESRQLNALVLPENATHTDLFWSSFDETIATVDENGLVTAVAEGDVVITVFTAEGGFSAECLVRVVVPVKSISMPEEPVIIALDGPPCQMSYTIEPTQATVRDVIWHSSNVAVVTVDSQGVVSPHSVGVARITATTRDGGYSASRTVSVTPETIESTVIAVSAGDHHSLAADDNGRVWAWGANYSGQLGDGTYLDRLSPVRVSALSGTKFIDAWGPRSSAINDENELVSWGGGSSPSLNGLTMVANGDGHSLGLKSDGTVWAWGDNHYGQLGDGTTSARATPIQVQGLSDVCSIAAGHRFSLALTADGCVWAFGNNDEGQLGDGTNETRLTPARVKNLDDVKQISAQYHCSLAVKHDGSVWTWGSGWGVHSRIPAQILNISDARSVSVGVDHALILKNDGNVWALGRNYYGQLGDDTTEYAPEPIQVKGLTSVIHVSAGNGHSLALDSDGSVWAWGSNSYGQLGDMTRDSRFSPARVYLGLSPDETSPMVTSAAPVAGSADVSPTTTVTLEFNEDVQIGREYGLLCLEDGNGSPVSLRSKIIKENKITLVSVNPLALGMTYTVVVPAGSVADLFHNELIEPFTSSFTVAADGSGGVMGAQSVDEPTEPTDPFADWSPVTTERINEARIHTINSGVLSSVRDNAILNLWWDPNVDHWMRYFAQGTRGQYEFLSHNYWGTTSRTVIDKAIVDYISGDFNRATVIREPILTVGPETAYPFVVDTYLTNSDGVRVDRVGAETVTVNVLFNRDMDQNVQPQVSFGPDVPETDYTVHPVGGGWSSPRLWKGEARITPITGDGYQFFRVAGAVAADDPWLVTGNDTERFRFEIITSGTEAMNLQAVGLEGKVALSWTQDDFDTLAGYRLYRSTSYEGPYEPVNTTLIPASQKTYDDTDVLPGKAYYYKFTVLKTDFTESDFSNVAQATPLDTIAPVILHTPIRSAAPNRQLQIYADVTDNVAVTSVTFFFRMAGDTEYTSRQMVLSTDDRYAVTLEGSLVVAPGIEYYIEAIDAINRVRHGRPETPHVITVEDRPVIDSVSPGWGPAAGGTVITLTGSNFKPGVRVQIGDALCDQVTLVDANHITAVTPQHLPAKVDVMVHNPDGGTSVLLRAFVYVSGDAVISLPDLSSNAGMVVEIPVSVNNVSGLVAADLTLTYDHQVLQFVDARLGNVVPGFVLASNPSSDGRVVLSLAGSTSTSGTGTLAVLEFSVVGSSGQSSPLVIESAVFNNGAIPVSSIAGSVTVDATRNISGTITYYGNHLSVSDFDVSAFAEEKYDGVLGTAGSYIVSGLIPGDYSVKPSKNTDVHDITAYDASLILQKSAGLIELSPNQMIAADVDGDGAVTSMDAAYVLQHSVGLRQPPFPGSGRVWAFVPADRLVTITTADQSGVNFVAVLIGDVSGNWGQSGALGGPSGDEASISLGTVRADKGQSVEVPMVFRPGTTELYSLDLVVSYDRACLVPEAITLGSAADGFSIVANATQPGEIRVGLAGTRPISDEGEVAIIKMGVVVAPVAHASLDIPSVMINEVNTIGTGGEVLVAIRGDVNLDNEVSLADIALLAERYGKMDLDPAQRAIADLNNDGVIDLCDLILAGRAIKVE